MAMAASSADAATWASAPWRVARMRASASAVCLCASSSAAAFAASISSLMRLRFSSAIACPRLSILAMGFSLREIARDLTLARANNARDARARDPPQHDEQKRERDREPEELVRKRLYVEGWKAATLRRSARRRRMVGRVHQVKRMMSAITRPKR